MESGLSDGPSFRHEKFLACISSAEKTPRRLIRKVARLATRYDTKFAVLYVQTPKESTDRIPLANQRYLLNHFKLASELGGEVIQVQSRHVPEAIVDVCAKGKFTTVCVGKPSFSFWSLMGSLRRYRTLVRKLSPLSIDLIILS